MLPKCLKLSRVGQIIPVLSHLHFTSTSSTLIQSYADVPRDVQVNLGLIQVYWGLILNPQALNECGFAVSINVSPHFIEQFYS